MEKFSGWICDTCHDLIQKADDGWIEWINYEDSTGNKGRDLRLVHCKPASPKKTTHGCQFDEKLEFCRDKGTISDLSLTHFLGSDGLMELLSLIAENELPTNQVLEMIKRLHIPGYEHARFHFDRAIAENVFEPNTLKGYYWQSDINAVLKSLKDTKD